MISLLVTVIVLGLIFYCVQLIPMPAPFPLVVRILFILVLIFILLNAFGLASGLPHLR